MDKGIIIGILFGLIAGLVIGWFVFSNGVFEKRINLQTENDVKDFVIDYANKNPDNELWRAFESSMRSQIDVSKDLDGNWYATSILDGQIVNLVLDRNGNIIQEPMYKSI